MQRRQSDSESFGAELSKLHGSDKDWTPNFDAYAKRGLWFANTYAYGTRTVRGLEAISASFPPIPTVSILHRPGNQGIRSWGQVMNDLGYQSSFLYGGYGSSPTKTSSIAPSSTTASNTKRANRFSRSS